MGDPVTIQEERADPSGDVNLSAVRASDVQPPFCLTEWIELDSLAPTKPSYFVSRGLNSRKLPCTTSGTFSIRQRIY